MTKEELEKEAEEYVSKYQGWGWTPHKGSAVYYAMLDSYIDSAEPREKQIEIDAKQIRALQKQNGELTDKVRELEDRLCNVANNLLDSWCRDKEDYCPHLAKLEKENENLEAQIEKMKCCYNCNNYCHRIDHRCNTKCKNLSEWEIKEK